MDSVQQRKTSVLMLPWLAHGHISPFLELSKKLTSRGNFHIFFCSTPVNLNSIKPKLPQKYSHCIELVELHLPYEELPELPPHYHTTNGLPPHLMPTLKKAFDMASDNFSNILKTLKPDLLIYDFLQPWAPSRALSKNIPAVQFYPSCAAMASFGNHRRCKSPSARFPFPSIYLRDYELMKFNNLGKSPSNGLSDGERVIVPVGSLVQEPLDGEGEETEIIKWLNTRERSSVVFVSFGTEYFLSKEEIQEIALGLELSNVCFIWVIRFPVGETTKIEELLPEGFMERVGERGTVVEGWAPQAKILQHSSIGGFVSHCGWSSVMESIKFCVPIIAIPMHLDQPLNARLVEEVGVGLEVQRTGSGSLEREEVAKAITEVLVEKIGQILKGKAMELSENMKNKEDEEIDGVVEELRQLCRTRESSST
ncbi:hypothetical protein TB2_040054 [Malus domestica]